MKSLKNINKVTNIEERILTPPSGGWGAFLILLIFTSCIDTIDVKMKDVKPKIVLNGIIEADSTITIRVTKTYPFTNDYYENVGGVKSQTTDTIIPNLLTEAKPVLYINDEPKGEFVFVKNDSLSWENGSVFHADFRPKSGDRVRIEISAEGFEKVWAETVIPQPILIHKVDTSTFQVNTNKIFSGDYEVPENVRSLNMALGIDVENPEKSKTGHYSIKIYQRIVVNAGQVEYEYFSDKELELNVSKEPLFVDNVEDEVLRFFLEHGNPKELLYFTDKAFTEKKYKLNLSVWGYYFRQRVDYNPDYGMPKPVYDEPLRIKIVSMSPEMYQTYGGSESEMDYYLTLLSEPKITYTNVHNGVGILGSFCTTEKVVKIPKYRK